MRWLEHSQCTERLTAVLVGSENQAVAGYIHRPHRKVTAQIAAPHRAYQLIHRRPQILCTGIEPTHTALRLHQNKAAPRKGYADIVDWEAGLTSNSFNPDLRIQPEPRRCATDCLRRPPGEHLGLKPQPTSGPSSSR